MAQTVMSGHDDLHVGPGVDLSDIQGLLRWGFGQHIEAVILLLKVTDRANPTAARRYLGQLQPSSAVLVNPVPNTLLQVALTSSGMRALGIPSDIVDGFSEEFLEGMAGDANRTRRLGDIGTNAPKCWKWGSGDQVPHVALLLFAKQGLEPFQRDIEAQCAAAGLEVTYRLPAFRRDIKDKSEPFGFADGLSQPHLDWERSIPAEDQEELTYRERSCLGEFILGYPNEYGLYTPRPQLDAKRDPTGSLLRSEEDPEKVDIGRNGSYLVIRQLHQNVPGFWRAVNARAHGVPEERARLGSMMVGRTIEGDPVVLDKPEIAGSEANSEFTFESDNEGHRCPIGAHIRRANPRNADLPPGRISALSWLIRTLGLSPQARAMDLAASTRFHRLLRRGRKYGTPLTPTQALNTPERGESGEPFEAGLQFICLNANIQRQFEFVQGAWLMSTKFDGLHEESDPILGNRVPAAGGRPCDYFTMPQALQPTQRLEGLPQFVTVLGGAYFFLPGIRALRYLLATHESMDNRGPR